jgi:HNH endonuclease
MRFWWVNQNQTFDQEFGGGYLWSPKRKANGARNPFYEYMRAVAPGDIIFSFTDTRIAAIGIAQSTAYESPKPSEFGSAGPNWSAIGWKVAVRYFRLNNPARPAGQMDVLGPLLPEKYSPLQVSGRGNQGVYLTLLSDAFARALIELSGKQAHDIVHANVATDPIGDVIPEPIPEIDEWEDYLAAKITKDLSLDDTQKTALVQARRGQGQFKKNVRMIEKKCRITGVDRLEHLVASHTKPWRDCETAEERLDAENGLLLTPSIDHLFDRGYISFESNGGLLISPVAHKDSIRKMGVVSDRAINVGSFSSGQKSYLEFHRDSIFLQAKIGSLN